MENKTWRKIKCLRSNNGTEYTYLRFTELCKDYGIKRLFIVRKTPQQICMVERINRSIAERSQCTILNVGLEKKFWAEAVSMACYLINRSPRQH